MPKQVLPEKQENIQEKKEKEEKEIKCAKSPFNGFMCSTYFLPDDIIEIKNFWNKGK